MTDDKSLSLVFNSLLVTCNLLLSLKLFAHDAMDAIMVLFHLEQFSEAAVRAYDIINVIAGDVPLVLAL